MSGQETRPARSAPLFMALGAIALTVSLGGQAPTQAIELVNANCESYTRLAVSCLPPREVHHVSPTYFTTWADTVIENVHCGWASGALRVADESNVNTSTLQVTAILEDSIYVHAGAASSRGGLDAQDSFARSDAVITFRVEPNREYAYRLTGELWTENPSTDGIDGNAKASFRLSRIESGVQSTIATYSVQAGPGPPTVLWHGLRYTGTLGPGDYILEGHCSAENLNTFGETRGQLWLRAKFRLVTTGVEQLTFGRVKALYR